MEYQELSQFAGPPVFLLVANATLTPATLNLICEFPIVRKVTPEPLAITVPDQQSEISQVMHNLENGPSADLPTVAVFDTGVHPDASLLQPWVISSEPFLTDFDTDYVHGTMVSSLVADARGLNANHDWLPGAPCHVHDVCGLESGSARIGDVIERLRTAVAHRPDIHVRNLSLGSTTGIDDSEFSEFARELDALSDQYGVLFVVAAGNYVLEPRRGWPAADGLLDRLSSPGDSVRSLTVGAIAHLDHDDGLVRSGEPASYSRRGPGPVYTPKPDLVHVGGGMKAPWSSDDTGMNVLAPDNSVVVNVGTSFAAPVVSAMAAHAWRSLEGDRQHPLTATPTLIKALMVHSAELASPHRSASDRRYFGAGTPHDPAAVLYDRDDSFTLLFEADLAANSRWLKTPYPIPAPLLIDGRLRAEIIVTAAYAPPLDAQFGAEYVRANVDVGFGVMQDDPTTGRPAFKGRVPLEGEPGTNGYETAQIEHGGKWSPIKVLRKRFPQGIGGNQWALRASMVRRAFEAPAVEPLRAILIVTLRSIDGDANIHAAGVRALQQTNWVRQSLPTHVVVQT